MHHQLVLNQLLLLPLTQTIRPSLLLFQKHLDLCLQIVHSDHTLIILVSELKNFILCKQKFLLQSFNLCTPSFASLRLE